MKRLLAALAVVAVALGVALAWRGPSAAQGDNLLQNPGFEGEYTERGAPEVSIANGWYHWYYDGYWDCPPDYPECDPESYYRRPEYKPEANPLRVRSGERAQKQFTSYSTHDAGLYQVVGGLPPGAWVRFSIWAQTWSSNRDDAAYSFDHGRYALSIGIDPEGGTDWRSARIRWSEPVSRPDEWVYLELDAQVGASGRVSVWTRGQQEFPVKHNDSYWDEARLVRLPSAPAPTPQPTATRTPYPTPTITDPIAYTAPTPPPPDDPLWHTLRHDTFEGGTLPPGWNYDPTQGRVEVTGGYLWVHSDEQDGHHAPLAWVPFLMPPGDHGRVTLRFGYHPVTAAGTSIIVSSDQYDGRRRLQGPDVIWGLDLGAVLELHGNEGGLRVDLLDQERARLNLESADWHTLVLERQGLLYTVTLDGEEIARGLSHWPPAALAVGGHVVVPGEYQWTGIRIGEIEVAWWGEWHSTYLPLTLRQ